LDILSKGSNPADIQMHYSKCFDAVEQLEFDPEEMKTGNAKTTLGFYDGGGEYVEFPNTFDASGPVETYLQALVEHQRESLRLILKDALSTYDPQKRHDWLFQYCAQLVLVASMILDHRGRASIRSVRGRYGYSIERSMAATNRPTAAALRSREEKIDQRRSQEGSCTHHN
jgi:hypothetical protein